MIVGLRYANPTYGTGFPINNVGNDRKKGWNRQRISKHIQGEQPQAHAMRAGSANWCAGYTLPAERVDERQAHEGKIVLNVVQARPAGVARPTRVVAGAVHVIGTRPEIQV